MIKVEFVIYTKFDFAVDSTFTGDCTLKLILLSRLILLFTRNSMHGIPEVGYMIKSWSIIGYLTDASDPGSIGTELARRTQPRSKLKISFTLILRPITLLVVILDLLHKSSHAVGAVGSRLRFRLVDGLVSHSLKLPFLVLWMVVVLSAPAFEADKERC